MSEEQKSDTHEPLLSDSSDYSKPLSKKKRNTLLVVFGVLVVAYLLYTFALDKLLTP